MKRNTTIAIHQTRSHGFEVFVVLVGGEWFAQFMSLAGARSKVMELEKRLQG